MATHILPSSAILGNDDTPARSSKPSLMRRVIDALAVAQSQRARREVDRVLGRGAYDRAMRGEWPAQP
jgi:hypothetical protein